MVRPGSGARRKNKGRRVEDDRAPARRSLRHVRGQWAKEKVHGEARVAGTRQLAAPLPRREAQGRRAGGRRTSGRKAVLEIQQRGVREGVPSGDGSLLAPSAIASEQSKVSTRYIRGRKKIKRVYNYSSVSAGAVGYHGESNGRSKKGRPEGSANKHMDVNKRDGP